MPHPVTEALIVIVIVRSDQAKPVQRASKIDAVDPGAVGAGSGGAGGGAQTKGHAGEATGLTCELVDDGPLPASKGVGLVEDQRATTSPPPEPNTSMDSPQCGQGK